MIDYPLVSIIITTFKRPDKLSRAIESVLNQNYQNLEIIVVDDNDSESEGRLATEKVMQTFENNQKIKYVKHEYNKNGAAARNTGIRHSEGVYITYLDDDDIYYSHKVSSQVEFLEKNKNFAGVYCGWTNGEQAFIPKYAGDFTFELLSGEVRLITNSIMLTRSSTLDAGGWDETFRRNQEFAFLLRVFKKGYEIGALEEILFEVDLSDRSNASNPLKNEQDMEYFLERHKEQIKSSSSESKKDEKDIYSYRARGVLLNYLKNRDYLNALKFYFKALNIGFFKFNKDLILYLYNKIRGKDFYS